ncbi:hypothetical protein BDY19DRAFT_897156 [Irpex rosettiformis]|uniref:Uncharacterized protein n=1 Tax=Irpex rosettiformis TaxID=378272 RepID=A0ACB8TTL3_9APHY|nr:hypothetical protein BDY19DRAFT_897156 [Irpex rosettiformis]
MEEEPEERVYFPRIPLPRYPPIWSQSRQEVCESFNKFRSYQGGVYFRKDLVEGYLLGGFSSRRDIFHNGGKLIISHGGGKAESIRKTDGHFQTHEARDQLQNDKSVRALLRTYQQREPVALLIDDKYALFPFDLTSKGCAYAVLGWYYIAHAWAEYQSAINAQGRVVRYKFAFQWADGQGEPWWNTYLGALGLCYRIADLIYSLVGPESPSDKYELCQTCRKSSPQVYEQGWMCLKPECERFWTLSDRKPAPVTLSYAQSFLEPRTGFRKHTEDIRPPLPVRSDEITGPTTSWHFCKGWHCTNCGRLSSRFKWEHWECRTCGVSEHEVHIVAVSGTQRLTGNIICGGYRNFKCDMGYASHCTFILPYNRSVRTIAYIDVVWLIFLPRGRIHLLLTNPLSTQDADKILTEYQEQSISGQLKFRRWPLRAVRRGILLTNYFSQNTGEPYQYVGGTDNTVSWDAAPSAVVHALDLIKRRIEQAELPCRADFNEVLSAAYMEKQKMAFHSDAERGLGPNVASLSLGGSAYMYFRLHSRFAATELSPGSSRDVLQFYLRHGDVLVMEGADVQNHYEHTVVPTNFRVAATARYIGSEHR